MTPMSFKMALMASKSLGTAKQRKKTRVSVAGEAHGTLLHSLSLGVGVFTAGALAFMKNPSGMHA